VRCGRRTDKSERERDWNEVNLTERTREFIPKMILKVSQNIILGLKIFYFRNS